MPWRCCAIAALAILVSACALAASPTGPAPRSPTPEPVPFPGRVTVIARGLDHPWGIALLPDGDLLVTERSGALRRVRPDGTVSAPLGGVPAVWAHGQGGLLDVALSPRFADDHLVYLSFAEPRGDDRAATAVARGRLGAAGLSDVTVIWRQQPAVEGPNHFGSRLVFDRDGMLFVTLGERYAYREQAQDLASLLGKVVRIAPDGSVPTGAPFASRADAGATIWSRGHRNVQAAALDPATGRLWTVEHGPRGGDELNHPEAGRNYGWPVISYGVNYDLTRVSGDTAHAGMEQPVYYWDPVIAPSGAAFYAGDAFPAWRGDLLVGSLTPGGLVRLVLREGRVAEEVRYREGPLHARIRDVAVAPDGRIWLVTDATDGQLLRLDPA